MLSHNHRRWAIIVDGPNCQSLVKCYIIPNKMMLDRILFWVLGQLIENCNFWA